MITPIDIAKLVSWNDVRKNMSFFYKGKWNNYEKIFKQIQKTKKAKHKDLEEFIEVVCGGDYNLIEKDERFFSISTNKYSMSFRPWKILSNIPFSEETLRRYPPEQLLAHFIWEITWFGSESNTKKEAKQLFKRVKEIKKAHLSSTPLSSSGDNKK